MTNILNYIIVYNLRVQYIKTFLLYSDNYDTKKNEQMKLGSLLYS